MIGRGKDAAELLGLVVLLGAYVGFQGSLAGRPFFVVPACLALGGYAVLLVRRGRAALREAGLRLDNLGPASRLTACYAVPMAVVLLGVHAATGRPWPPPRFYALALLYPLWGVAQQLLFQGILHVRLRRLGLGRWSVLLTALAFAGVHWPSGKLVLVALIGGLGFAYSFAVHPNVLPIGVAHGILGAMVYYLLLGQDVLERFWAG
ncbi:MAG: hypothetical protein Kow0092_23550 [Deferrisomatales bacterium]